MKFLIPVIVLCIAVAACSKKSNEPQYQPSQTGADILYCKINGVEHVYRHKGTYLNDNGVNIMLPRNPDSSRSVQISADDVQYGDGMYLYADVWEEPDGQVVMDLDKRYPMLHSFYDESAYIQHIISKEGNFTFEYLIDTAQSFVVFTRFDEKVISGRFYFEAHYKDSLHVTATDGFFDIAR